MKLILFFAIIATAVVLFVYLNRDETILIVGADEIYTDIYRVFFKNATVDEKELSDYTLSTSCSEDLPSPLTIKMLTLLGYEKVSTDHWTFIANENNVSK